MRERIAIKTVDSQTIARMRYYAPLFVLAACGAILFSGHLTVSVFASRALLNAPFILVACFLLTVTEVRAADNFVEYRRLVRWIKVPYTQIEQCEKSLFPGVAYLKLVRSDGSVSRLYFVSGPPIRNSRRETEMTAYINTRLSGKPTRDDDIAARPNLRARESRQFCLIVGLAGVLGSLLFALVDHRSRPEPDFQAWPWAVAMAQTIFWKAINWPWGLITCTLLIAEIVRLRYQQKAWMVSFIAGFLLGSILVQAMRLIAL